MENNDKIFSGLQEYAKLSQAYLNGFLKDLSKVREGLTPDQQKTLDDELAKANIPGAMADLKEDVNKLKDLSTQL